MARKIKKKPVPKESKEGVIIISVTGAILGIILIILLTLAIYPNCTGSSDDNEESSAPAEYSYFEFSDTESSVVEASTQSFETPEFLKSVVIDETKDYYVDIDIKDYGVVSVKLDYEAAPITVKNFVYLTESGFYNGLTFHRIMDGFMMQGGDPQHNGYGGSENTIPGEFTSNGFNNTLSHTKGAISMARSNDKDSASSQFFIVQTDDHTSTLDGNYACFGYVTSGMPIVEKICKDAKPTDTNGTINYEEQPVINTMTIRTEDKA